MIVILCAQPFEGPPPRYPCGLSPVRISRQRRHIWGGHAAAKRHQSLTWNAKDARSGPTLLGRAAAALNTFNKGSTTGWLDQHSRPVSAVA
jgi:hypothetical protein